MSRLCYVPARMALLACALLFAWGSAGCQASQEGAPRPDPAPNASEQAISEQAAAPSQALRELSTRVKHVHQVADKASTTSEKQAAAELLTDLFEETATPPSPHVTAIRQDLAARASQLRLEEAPLEAKRLAEQGLSLSDTPSVLLANLFIALADAEEALKNSSQARSALVSALTINEQLFEAELQHP